MSSRPLSIVFALALLLAIFITGGNGRQELPQSDRATQAPKEERRAQLSSLLPALFATPVEEPYPKRKPDIPEIELGARAAIVISEDGKRVFFAKSPDDKVFVASLAKLMTAWVAAKALPFDLEITVSEQAVFTEGENGRLVVGETLRLLDLLKVMLLESSNDAAQAIAEHIGEQEFVKIMNEEAARLGLTNTHFSNPMGFDDPFQYSSGRDIARLAALVTDDLNLGAILATPRSTIFSTDGRFQHSLKNSNELLGKITEVIAGKTGYTEGAGGCLVEILKIGEMRVVAVVLGSEDRFGEMEKLIEWVKGAYEWEQAH